jgi:polysaccharide export outer membrane protein
MKQLLLLTCVCAFSFAQNLTTPESSDSLASVLRIPDTPFDEPYLIESGDLLEIVIMGEEELSRTLMVMHNGTISFPLIGEVKLMGLTTDQAEAVIAEKLKEYYTYPMVSVVLKSPTQPYVSVFGEVMRQGAVEYQRGLRVTDYIALAGGPTSKANLGKVKIVRFQEGKAETSMLDMNAILKSGDISQNYELKSGDWIYVYKRFSINWTHVLQFATLTLTAINLYITIQNSE